MEKYTEYMDGLIGRNYVFENSDGSITNIQYNENGDMVQHEYSNGEKFTIWMGMRDLKPNSYYREFYNEIYFVNPKFNFIGEADGYDRRLFD